MGKKLLLTIVLTAIFSVLFTLTAVAADSGTTNTVSTTSTGPAINLWVSVDDFADVYIDGKRIDVDPSYQEASELWIEDVDENSFAAAEARDLAAEGTANIVGFRMSLDRGSDYLVTDKSWYYYYKPDNGQDGLPPLSNGLNWFDEGYEAEGWLPAHEIDLDQAWANGSAPAWADDSAFPSTSKWIWTPKYDYTGSGTEMDTPIYIRSLSPYLQVEIVVVGDPGDSSVTFNKEDAVLGSSVVDKLLYEEAIDIQVNTQDGYSFDGWDVRPPANASESAVYTATFSKDIVTSYLQVEIVVAGDPGNSSVTFNEEEAVFGSSVVKQLLFEDVIELQVNTEDGYSFDGWDVRPPSMASESAVYTATFSKDKVILKELYEVIFDVYPEDGSNDGFGSVLPDSGIYEMNDRVPLVVTPANGYKFVKWWGEFDVSASGSFDQASTDFQVVYAPLSVDDFDGDTFLVDGKIMSEDGLYAHNMMPNMVPGSLTRVLAEFEALPTTPSAVIITIEVTGNAGDSRASVNGNDATKGDSFTFTVDKGTSLSFDYDTDRGHRFDGWNLELPSTAEVSATYIADFSKKRSKKEEFILTVEIIGNGDVADYEGITSYDDGDKVTLEALVNDLLKDEFVDWTGDIESTQPIIEFTMNEDIDLVATFRELSEEPEEPEEPEEILDPTIIPEGTGTDTDTDTVTDIVEEELPKTSGIPMLPMALSGITLIGSGLYMKKRR